MPLAPRVVHLHDGGTSVVVHLPESGLPVVVHWGEEIADADAAALAAASVRQRVSGGLDIASPPSVVPLPSEGWLGSPGLSGSRLDGRDPSPLFAVTDIDAGPSRLLVTARDERAALSVVIDMRLSSAGLVRLGAELVNDGDGDYRLDRLDLHLPVPADATELLHPFGRHLRERSPQRQPFTVGTLLRESRGGRTGAGAPLLLSAGRRAFGFERGRVHAVHLAWSGSSRLIAERTAGGDRLLGGGEVFEPGELILAPGSSHRTPDLVASWGDGLDRMAARIHRDLRSRPGHPSSPRPVTLNTWEAVYFDHRLDRLQALAEVAAAVGVERFVLDDGWFRGRRGDTAGLGDWYVDETVWPDGLDPLVQIVTGLGLQFGLWVEPEMVNPDSDLARAHPDWILAPTGRLPREGRQQHVLDLSNPDASAYILERLDSLLTEYDISYLKWDHNRELLEAGSRSSGRAAAHANTVALYALLDELRRRHPGVEIESCASGGARIDLGILERTDRVWTSDCIDPIERLDIQRYTGLLLPPELMGMHIGSERAHSTGRVTDLDLRAGVALPGHLGIEWDLTKIDPDALDALTAWVGYHRENRGLLHSGVVVNGDLADDSADLRGVVAPDGSAALYTFTQVDSSESYPPERITLPGLQADRLYRVALRWGGTATYGQSDLEWALEGVELTGAALSTAGIRPPVLQPQQLVVLEVIAV